MYWSSIRSANSISWYEGTHHTVSYSSPLVGTPGQTDSDVSSSTVEQSTSYYTAQTTVAAATTSVVSVSATASSSYSCATVISGALGTSSSSCSGVVGSENTVETTTIALVSYTGSVTWWYDPWWGGTWPVAAPVLLIDPRSEYLATA